MPVLQDNFRGEFVQKTGDTGYYLNFYWTPNMLSANYPPDNNGAYRQIIQQLNYYGISSNPTVMGWRWEDVTTIEDLSVDNFVNSMSYAYIKNQYFKFRLGIVFVSADNDLTKNAYYFGNPIVINSEHDELQPLGEITVESFTYNDINYGSYTIALSLANNPNSFESADFVKNSVFIDDIFQEDFYGNNLEIILDKTYPIETPSGKTKTFRIDQSIFDYKVSGTPFQIKMPDYTQVPDYLPATDLTASGTTLTWVNHTSGSYYMNWNVNGTDVENSGGGGGDFGWFDNNSGLETPPTTIDASTQTQLQPDTDYTFCVITGKAGCRLASNKVTIHTPA